MDLTVLIGGEAAALSLHRHVDAINGYDEWRGVLDVPEGSRVPFEADAHAPREVVATVEGGGMIRLLATGYAKASHRCNVVALSSVAEALVRDSEPDVTTQAEADIATASEADHDSGREPDVAAAPDDIDPS